MNKPLFLSALCCELNAHAQIQWWQPREQPCTAVPGVAATSCAASARAWGSMSGEWSLPAAWHCQGMDMEVQEQVQWRPLKVKCQTWQVAGEAEGAGLLQPGEVKRRLRRGLVAGHSCLTRGCREDKARLFLEAIQQKATSTRWKVGSYNKLYGKYSADEGGEAQAALCDLHPWRSWDSAGHIPEQLDLLRAALSRSWTRGLRRSLPASVFLWFSVGSTDLRTDKNRITVPDKLTGKYIW